MEEKERREIIINFISENQRCTAEELVKGVKDKISRVPVFDTLQELVKEGIVKDQKINRRDHRLIVDSNNPIVETSRELDEFENIYISFLKKVKEHINERHYELKNRKYFSPEFNTPGKVDGRPFYRPLSGDEQRALDEAKEFFYAGELISQSLHIFSEILKMYMLRSITIWPSVIKDQDFLKLLNSVVFAKFSDIQIHMDEIFRSIKIPRGGVVSLDSLSDDALLDTATELRESLKKFNNHDIKKEAKEVSNFVRYLIGFDMIRRTDYASTSKYKWDITQVNRESLEKTKDDMYRQLEDYENPFLDDD